MISLFPDKMNEMFRKCGAIGSELTGNAGISRNKVEILAGKHAVIVFYNIALSNTLKINYCCNVYNKR